MKNKLENIEKEFQNQLSSIIKEIIENQDDFEYFTL